MSKPKLKTCPFCGGPAEAIQPRCGRGHPWNISCDSCSVVLFGDSNSSLAKQAVFWNRRKNITGEGNE